MSKLIIMNLKSLNDFHPINNRILLKLFVKENEGSIKLHPKWSIECNIGEVVKVGDEPYIKVGGKVAYREGAGDLVTFDDQPGTYFVLIDREECRAIVED